MKEIKVDTKKSLTVKSGAGSAAYQRLLDTLSTKDGYSMKVQEAMDMLYPGDQRPASAIRNSFATVKSHCWSKADWRLEFINDNITIVGKRKKGTEEYHPIA